MSPFVLALLAVAVAAAPAASGQRPPSVDPEPVRVHDVRVRVGDDARWASPSWDDGSWEARSLHDPPDVQGPLWLRAPVRVPPGSRPLGIAVGAAAAWEVYWDGVLVGGSGRVGTSRETEVPGPIDAVFSVPDSLAGPGRHLLALRLSTFHRPPSVRRYLYGVTVGELSVLVAHSARGGLLPLVFLGGFVLVALYYGVLYAVDRRRTPYLLVALLCAAVAALLGAESWRWVAGYTYDLHLARLLVVGGLVGLIGLLLPATFLVQFRVPYRRLIGALLALGVASAFWIPSYDAKALGVFWVSLPVALGASVWAVGQRKPGARFALAGVVVCLGALAVSGYHFLDAAFFPAFGVLVAGLLASLGLQTREDRRRHRAAEAAAARLEAELLKKHLQPHFLMNTLTSVLEWVETDPATGARALEALADELRALSRLSGERLIPMGEELALCRAHLDVMGFRRDVQFELDAEDVDLQAPVPPAVLHTLVENAVTHNAYSGRVRLALCEQEGGGQRRLTLRAPLVGPVREKACEGGGLRYVRARLEESLPGAWALTYGVEGEAWVTRLDLSLGPNPPVPSET